MPKNLQQLRNHISASNAINYDGSNSWKPIHTSNKLAIRIFSNNTAFYGENIRTELPIP
jgi:hypothetical protein